MVIWRKDLGYIFGCFREGPGPLKFFFPSLFFPLGLLGWASKKAGRKERKRKQAAGRRVNPTIRLHQTQRSRLPNRCTPQQCDATGWWPRRCPQHPASLVPAAPQPCAAESLDGWLKASHCGHRSQEARRTWAWWCQKVAEEVQPAGHLHH